MINFPLVSVIIPVRNEKDYIEECLNSFFMQDYPQDCLEILVVDGLSNDGSWNIVARLSQKHTNIKLLKNEKQRTSSALNLGIQNAQGEIITVTTAHGYVAPDYISQCVHYLQITDADNVGGLLRAVGHGYIGQAIALIYSCAFGFGNNKMHTSSKEQYADNAWPGAYRRDIFDKIGLYDEELIRNQDIELNYRLRQAGGRIFLGPSIKSYYYCRSSLRGLWEQNFQTGMWNIKTMKKTPGSLSIRYFVPFFFVASLILGALFSLLSPLGFLFFLAIVLVYSSCAIAFSIHLALQRGWRYILILPLVFAYLHLSYGLGSLIGLMRFGILHHGE